MEVFKLEVFGPVGILALCRVVEPVFRRVMDDGAIGDGAGTAKRDAPINDFVVFVVILLGKELEQPPTKSSKRFVKFVFG
jgi:hypothetical protein